MPINGTELIAQMGLGNGAIHVLNAVHILKERWCERVSDIMRTKRDKDNERKGQKAT